MNAFIVNWVNAEEFASEDRVGQRVITQKYGDWPGGPATVVRMHSDPEAPEIVMDVRDDAGEEIGVFDHEVVGVVVPLRD